MKKKVIGLLTVLMLISTLAFSATVGPMINAYSSDRDSMIGVVYPQWVDAIVLVANTAVTYYIPTGTNKVTANYLMFSSSGGADFYVNYGATAAVPGTSVTNGTAPELNPLLRCVNNLTAISIIAPVGCVLTISAFVGSPTKQ